MKIQINQEGSKKARARAASKKSTVQAAAKHSAPKPAKISHFATLTPEELTAIVESTANEILPPISSNFENSAQTTPKINSTTPPTTPKTPIAIAKSTPKPLAKTAPKTITVAPKATVAKPSVKTVIKPLKRSLVKPSLKTITKNQPKTLTKSEPKTLARPAPVSPPAKRHPIRFALACVCSLIIAVALGAFLYFNLPNISVSVAAAQTGINAVYPSYIPRDYALVSVSADSSNLITMKFTNSALDTSFTLTEENSTWDSTALLSNYVKTTFATDYTTLREQGITIYLDDSHAAWVNGGILYKISGSLTKNQIRLFATAL